MPQETYSHREIDDKFDKLTTKLYQQRECIIDVVLVNRYDFRKSYFPDDYSSDKATRECTIRLLSSVGMEQSTLYYLGVMLVWKSACFDLECEHRLEYGPEMLVNPPFSLSRYCQNITITNMASNRQIILEFDRFVSHVFNPRWPHSMLV